MKLSIETGIFEQRFGIDKALRMLKDAGFEHIDYSFYHPDVTETLARDDYRDYFVRLRALIDSCGLKVTQAHAPFRLTYFEERKLSEPKYLEIVRSIEAAAILGAPHIISHALYVPLDTDDDPDEVNYDYYTGLIPYCKQFGIRIGFENIFHYDAKRRQFRELYGDPKRFNALLDRLDPAYFIACADLGHAAMVGNEPEDFVRRVSEGRLHALHVQDGDYLDDRHILPYLGKYDWGKIMTALKARNYTGDLSFETFKFFQGLPDRAFAPALLLARTIGDELIEQFDRA